MQLSILAVKSSGIELNVRHAQARNMNGHRGQFKTTPRLGNVATTLTITGNVKLDPNLVLTDFFRHIVEKVGSVKAGPKII